MSMPNAIKFAGKAFFDSSDSACLFGPIGQLLLRNIENNWFQHCVTMPNYNVYLANVLGVEKTLKYLHSSKKSRLPIGLATIETVDTDVDTNDMFEFTKLQHQKLMRLITVVDEYRAKDLFFVKQRERKIWWRKFGNKPSRFTLKTANDIQKSDAIQISAKFSFGEMAIETISHGRRGHCFEEYNENLPDNTEVVEHVMSLELAFFTFLCDGYSEDNHHLYIQPALAPYKSLIYVTPSDGKDLDLLATYLSNQLKAANLNSIVLMNPNEARSLLIPYVIILDNMSLRDGIVRVNCQLNTLDEKVHITRLVEYISERCA